MPRAAIWTPPLALALATLAPAQVVVTAQSLGIQLQAGAAAPLGLAPGADAGAGVDLQLATWTAAAAFAFAPAVAPTAVELQAVVQARAWPSAQAHSDGGLRVWLDAAVPLAGQVEITWLPAASGTGQLGLQVDLGDDGFVDATGSVVLPLTLGHGAVPLRLALRAAATAGSVAGPWGATWTYQGHARGELRLRFVPGHVAASAFAAGCSGGPALLANGDLAGGIRLQGVAAPAGGLQFAVFGAPAAPWALPLPPGCGLAVAPWAALLGAPDGPGAAVWGLAAPPLRPVAFAAQVVALDAAVGAAWTSPALLVTCH